MYTKYPIKDRVLPIVWDLQIVNGFLRITESEGEFFPEIKLRDEFIEDKYWLLYVKNGVIGVEDSAVQDHDTIILLEVTTLRKLSLGINNGVLKTRAISERTDTTVYYMQDRDLPIVWKMYILNGLLTVEESDQEDQGEINVLDDYLPDTYWTIYLKRGVFGIEISEAEVNTTILFRELVTMKLYRLSVRNGVLKCPEIIILTTDEYSITLVLKNIRTDLRGSPLPAYFERPDEYVPSDRRLLQVDLKNSELPVSYERKEYE